MSDDLQTERAVFRCSTALIEVIDKAAAASFSSRSDYVRAAVVERLKREGAIVNMAAVLAAYAENNGLKNITRRDDGAVVVKAQTAEA